MLPIDATTTDVANDNKEDISKVYAADTDSDTDDEKPIKKHTSGEPKTQASNGLYCSSSYKLRQIAN